MNYLLKNNFQQVLFGDFNTAMHWIHIILAGVSALSLGTSAQQQFQSENDFPEGYYAFQEAPGKVPPKVRKPPYLQSKIPCLGALETKEETDQSLNNLCGDLNDGRLPLNPMGQKVLGHSYPFDLIKNISLDFFSRTLPILKEDQTLPKVAKLRSQNVPLSDQFRIIRRPIRSIDDDANDIEDIADNTTNFEVKSRDLNGEFEYITDDDKDLLHDADPAEKLANKEMKVEGRGARAFCDDNWGLFCLLYNTVSGNNPDAEAENRNDDSLDPSINSLRGQPLTPCPSAVEYITPVFARNYQGMWRYVVQIPYEGYFTQTVEVTQCLSSKCHYLSGACLASPRWVSLLVAEIYYPDAVFPASGQRPDFSRAAVASDNPPKPTPGGSGGFPSFNLQRRQGTKDPSTSSQYCDGHDDIGCFQVRLYYDWFLIPGSCKCWKQDYFAQLAYRK